MPLFFGNKPTSISMFLFLLLKILKEKKPEEAARYSDVNDLLTHGQTQLHTVKAKYRNGVSDCDGGHPAETFQTRAQSHSQSSATQSSATQSSTQSSTQPTAGQTCSACREPCGGNSLSQSQDLWTNIISRVFHVWEMIVFLEEHLVFWSLKNWCFHVWHIENRYEEISYYISIFLNS